MQLPPTSYTQGGGGGGGGGVGNASPPSARRRPRQQWLSLNMLFVVFLCLCQLLAGVGVGIIAEHWLFNVAAIRGQAVGVLIAFIGMVGMVGSVAQNAEVMRLSIAGGLVSLLMCGNMLNEVRHDIQAECGLAAFENRVRSIENVLHGRTEPEMFAQIMSRMHELDNGISNLDKKSDDVHKHRLNKVYMKQEQDRDASFLRERLEVLEAHVHHLLNDPIVVAYEKKVDKDNAVLAEKMGVTNETDVDAVTEEGVEKKKGVVQRLTTTGDECVFPVVYRGEVHTDCINIGEKAMCRTDAKKWLECAPLQGADEFADPISVIDPNELDLIEKTVQQLKAVADFLDDLDDLHNLSSGDIHYLINILKDAHLNFETSQLNTLLGKERMDYVGGDKGKEELMKHLADELIEKEGDAEKTLQRYQVCKWLVSKYYADNYYKQIDYDDYAYLWNVLNCLVQNTNRQRITRFRERMLLSLMQR